MNASEETSWMKEGIVYITTGRLVFESKFFGSEIGAPAETETDYCILKQQYWYLQGQEEIFHKRWGSGTSRPGGRTSEHTGRATHIHAVKW